MACRSCQGRPASSRSHCAQKLPNRWEPKACAGDVLAARSQIASYEERKGSIGDMLIITSKTTYTNQDGNVVQEPADADAFPLHTPSLGGP